MDEGQVPEEQPEVELVAEEGGQDEEVANEVEVDPEPTQIDPQPEVTPPDEDQVTPLQDPDPVEDQPSIHENEAQIEVT